MGRWERSGLSVSGFCRREGVSVSSFYYWRRRLADDAAVESAELFVPLRVTNRAADRIEIELPNRAIVRLPGDCDGALLCRLVQTAGSITAGSPHDGQEDG
jgi:transposase-like protein